MFVVAFRKIIDYRNSVKILETIYLNAFIESFFSEEMTQKYLSNYNYKKQFLLNKIS